MESGIINKTAFFPLQRVTEKEASGMAPRKDAALDLTTVYPLALLGQAEPDGQPVLEQQLVEHQEACLHGSAAGSQSNLHLAQEGAQQHGCSVLLCFRSLC